jgi:hypothetical protein
VERGSWLFQGSKVITLTCVDYGSVVLAPMASFELCTEVMSDFMGPGKLSSFYNYFIELHLHASCGAFTFGWRMRPRAKTSSREQGFDFDLVGTYERLSYVRASGS